MEAKRKARSFIPPLVLAGCLFTGISAGLMCGNITAGTLIGLGSGFILMAILRYAIAARNRKRESSGNS